MIVTVGKAGFKIYRAHRRRRVDTAGDKPRAIGLLGLQQVLQTSLVRIACDRKTGRLMQRRERLTRRVGVTRAARQLAPSAIGLLQREQVFTSFRYRLRFSPGTFSGDRR